jgi:hypothetical protein
MWDTKTRLLEHFRSSFCETPPKRVKNAQHLPVFWAKNMKKKLGIWLAPPIFDNFPVNGTP